MTPTHQARISRRDIFTLHHYVITQFNKLNILLDIPAPDCPRPHSHDVSARWAVIEGRFLMNQSCSPLYGWPGLPGSRCVLPLLLHHIVCGRSGGPGLQLNKLSPRGSSPTQHDNGTLEETSYTNTYHLLTQPPPQSASPCLVTTRGTGTVIPIRPDFCLSPLRPYLGTLLPQDPV